MVTFQKRLYLYCLLEDSFITVLFFVISIILPTKIVLFSAQMLSPISIKA